MAAQWNQSPLELSLNGRRFACVRASMRDSAAVFWGHKEVPVTQLRKMTLEELARRNYTESTTRAYLRIIEDLARYFHRPPDQLGPEQIREYTAHLFRDRKLSDNTVNQMVGALRFFFLKTLKRPWSGDEMHSCRSALPAASPTSPSRVIR